MSFESLVAAAELSVSDSGLDAAYEGTRRVGLLGLNVSPKTRALELQINYPRLTVDTTAESLIVEGFESAGTDDSILDRLKTEWDANNMPALSHFMHTEAMIQGEGYVIVGLDGAGRIRTTAHAKDGIAVEMDREGRAGAAVVRFSVPNESGGLIEKAAYYTPERVEVFQQANGLWGLVSSTRGVGLVPVVPVRNLSRVGQAAGVSEMNLVLGLGDVASRAMTLLQVAMEILAMPQRYIAGADMSKMKDQNGVPVTPEQLYLGSFLLAPNSDAKMGQFPGANLDQIIQVIKTCSELVSAVTGIPPSMLGVATSNPASAEAMRAAKDRMISRCEAKQDVFGDVWEQWAYLVLAFAGVPADEVGTVNTVWRDVAVASASAKAANLLQAHAQGIVSARTARDGIQLTPEQKTRENKRDVEAEFAGATGELFGVQPGGGL